MSESTVQLNEAKPLPQGWRWVKLGNTANIVNGFGFPNHLQGNTKLKFPFVKVADMNLEGNETYITHATNTVDEATLQELGAQAYPPGTVIFPKVGGAIATNKKRILAVQATFDNNIMGVVPGNSILSEWTYWVLESIDLSTMSRVTAVPSIRQSDIASLTIPYPPMTEQKRIVAKVWDLSGEIERARTAYEAQLEAARALPSTYLRQVFESEEAKKWEREKLGKVASVFSGSSAPQDPKYFQDGVYPFVRVQDLGRVGRTLKLSGVQDKVNDIAVKELSLSKAEVGVVLFPKSGAAIHTNSRAILDMDAYIVSHLAAVRPNENVVSSEWIYFWLCTQNMADYSDNIGYPSLRLSVIKSMTIPLPPLSTQQHLTLELRDKIADVEELQASIEKQLDAINTLPQAILRKAFFGEL